MRKKSESGYLPKINCYSSEGSKEARQVFLYIKINNYLVLNMSIYSIFRMEDRVFFAIKLILNMKL